MAPRTLTSPAPMSKGDAGLPRWSSIGFPELSASNADVIIADLMADGDQVWWAAFTNAAAPLTCGVAMEVPEMMLKREEGPLGGPCGKGHAARMLTPGPLMSGFRIPGVALLGPLDEKYAMLDVKGPPMTVPLKMIVAVGLDAEAMYFLISDPV